MGRGGAAAAPAPDSKFCLCWSWSENDSVDWAALLRVLEACANRWAAS